jgi:glycosyltransferase involved in cell wall biosynthesis
MTAVLSITIPTWNRDSELDGLLACIHDQTSSDPDLAAAIDVLVSDNGSDDSTPDVVARWQAKGPFTLHSVRHPANRGPIPNINHCLQHAPGRHYILLGDDDRPLGQVLEGAPRRLGEVAHEAGRDLAHVELAIPGHFEVGALLRGKDRLGQRALAKAVDRGDRGLVEALQGEFQAPLEELVVQARVATQGGEQRGNEGVCGRGGGQACQVVARFHEAGADAVAQLRRGRLREGDHEDLLDREPALEQQPQVQRAQVPGLAGACGGLDEVCTLEGAREHGQRERGGHGCHASRRWSRRGASTACAVASNPA